jgi:type IV pilus assembly protein PilW
MMRAARVRPTARGFSIIELLVALTIGTVLIGGAVYIYSQSRKSFAVNDTVARLQENARFVFSVMEPDIQLAGYYGFSNNPQDFKYISGGSTSAPHSAIEMQTSAASAISGYDTNALCGKNFALDVIATVQGTNNKYDLACDALGGGAETDTDTLTIRRSSLPPADGMGAAVDKRLQMLVSRLSPTNQYVFADGKLPTAPALKADLVQVRDLIVRTYYVAKDSTSPAQTGMPSLRVKALTDGPSFDNSADTEIMRGVEDMQVQFGIDTGD